MHNSSRRLLLLLVPLLLRAITQQTNYVTAATLMPTTMDRHSPNATTATTAAAVAPRRRRRRYGRGRLKVFVQQLVFSRLLEQDLAFFEDDSNDKRSAYELQRCVEASKHVVDSLVQTPLQVGGCVRCWMRCWVGECMRALVASHLRTVGARSLDRAGWLVGRLGSRDVLVPSSSSSSSSWSSSLSSSSRLSPPPLSLLLPPVYPVFNRGGAVPATTRS
jgi:hypothetical protein